MAYASGGLIEASDLNSLVDLNTVNLNKIWSTGSSDSGYGQTAVSSVVAGGTVLATSWAATVNTEKTIGNHQGTTLTAMTAPTAGSTISYNSALSPNLSLLNTNRLNAAAQGGTVTSTSTTTATWNDNLVVTFTVTFSSNNAARYFFNAGGQIGIYASHPAGSTSSINQLISDLCSDAGTTWFSSPTSGTVSLAGINYNGVTKVGGANPAGSTINTNYGFYNSTTTSTQLAQQYSDFSYHSYQSGTFMRINVANNGTGMLTFTVLYDEVPDGATVSAGTVTTLAVRNPSTTYLSNSWGTPSLANSYVITNLPTLAVEYLLVAGGASGGAGDNTYGSGGGGGAGGLLYSASQSLNTGSAFTVTVGAGGASVANNSALNGNSGSNSIFGSITAIGGGGGGAVTGTITAANYGGSGGGQGGRGSGVGGAGTAGQGYAGGSGEGIGIPGNGGGGGGGGAGAVGGAAISGGGGGAGGAGAQYSINGTATYYAGGGGGALGGAGGIGGGGSSDSSGTVNTGGGGGGNRTGTGNSGAGGSGIAIIAYPGTVALATGGTISTISRPGYVVHTFTTSGTFTVI